MGNKEKTRPQPLYIKSCGLRPRFLQEQVQDVAARLQEQLQPTREKFERLYEDYFAYPKHFYPK